MNANDRNQNVDLRDQPAYALAEASRYLKLPSATLRSWVVGRPYPKSEGVGHSPPLIHPPQKQPLLLTFWNLIEAHVLRSLRTEHGVSIKALRQALSYAQQSEQIDRLLLSKDLRTNAGKLFLEKYGELIELSASGQLAMRKLFEEHLKRVEWDEWQFPVRLYPFVSGEADRRPIAIDPKSHSDVRWYCEWACLPESLPIGSTQASRPPTSPKITASACRKSRRRSSTSALLEPGLFH